MAREAYRSYRDLGDASMIPRIITHGETAVALPDDGSLDMRGRKNEIEYWLGLAYLKQGHAARGIRHIEGFLRGIDRYEEMARAAFHTRERVIEKVNQERIDAAEESAKWGKVFAFALMAVGAYAAVNTPTGGDLTQTQSNQMQYSAMQSLSHGVQMLRSIDATVQTERLEGDVRKEVAKFITPYSLKVNRYLNKFEMVDFFIAAGIGYEALGKFEKALSQYREAARIIERQRTTIFTERQRIAFFAAKQALYDRIVPLLVRLGRTDDALEWTERAKSRAFVDILGSTRLKLKTRSQDRQYMSALKRQAEVDTILSGSRIGNGQLKHLIGITERAIKVQKKTNAPGTGMELQSLSSVRTLDAGAIRSFVGDNAVLLEYYLVQDRLIIFVVHASGVKAMTLPVHRVNLERQVHTLLSQIRQVQEHPSEAKALYDQLISPVAAQLDKPQLIIVPHGILHYVPFQALHDGSRFLIEKYALSYAPSATVLGIAAGKPKAETAKALVIGNPTRDLAFAEKEAIRISQMMRQHTLLTREKGTESFLRNHGKDYDVIHLATHAIYDEADPLNSRILLGADGGNDGVLTVDELFSLNWRASLVTLSACESGLSKRKPGDELVGFQRGLFFAGTRSILSSLWPVDDRATGFLMESFYRHLSAMPANAALRKAQMETMNAFRAPFFWSAFCLSGAPA